MPSKLSLRHWRSACLALSFLVLAGTSSAVENSPRPANWANPITAIGLPNLHQVTPTLYRSAQPEVAGLPELQRLGVRTVLSLRASDADAALDRRSEISFLRHPLWTWDVEDEDVLEVLRVLTDAERQPVLLHCKHGADRTGLMIASYRVVVQGWSKQAALDEMKQGGYGYHVVWRNIEKRLLALDVARLQAALVLPAARATP